MSSKMEECKKQYNAIKEDIISHLTMLNLNPEDDHKTNAKKIKAAVRKYIPDPWYRMSMSEFDALLVGLHVMVYDELYKLGKVKQRYHEHALKKIKTSLGELYNWYNKPK